MDNTGESTAAVVTGQEPVRGRRGSVSLSGGRVFERITVIDEIVNEIRTKIATGELKDGDALPSQDEIARSLGVSRASLREALNRLALMGLIEIQHGRGTFVRTARPTDLMNSLSSLIVMDRPSAAELLQARFHVESALAALAAMNATAEDIERIRQLAARMERDKGTLEIDTFVPFDTQLHMAIAQSSKNPVLVKVLEVIWGVLPERIRRITHTGQIPTFLGYHAEICDAIARHDPVAARQAMERHVEFLIDENERARPHHDAK